MSMRIPILKPLLLLLIGLTPFAIANEFALSPPNFHIQIDGKPVTKSLKVFNFGSEPTEFQVSVANWVLDEQNEVQVIAPTEQSLDQWLLVNPLRITVPPKESRTVRFSVRPRVQPTPGEHRAMIYLTEVRSKARGHIKIRGRLGVAVYGYVGDVVKKGKLHGIQVEAEKKPVKIAFDVESLGNAHVRLSGQYAIWPADRYPGSDKTRSIASIGTKKMVLPEGVVEAGNLVKTPVLPGTRRKVVLFGTQALKPGSYVLDVNGALQDTPLKQGVFFEVKAPEQAATP